MTNRLSLAVLWLSCAMFGLAGVAGWDRAMAQVTTAPVACPAAAGSATTIARLVGEGGTCTSDVATAAEYNDPSTARASIGFQILLPGDGTSHPRIFARDASGTPLNITSLSCGSQTVRGIGSTVGEVEVNFHIVGNSICLLYVFWENGDSDLSFAGARLGRNNSGEYFIDERGALAGGGQFDGLVATAAENNLVLQHNGATLSDGDTDDLGTQTVGTPITLTYTFSNLGGDFSSFVSLEIEELRNIQSFALTPPDPRYVYGVERPYIPVGASFSFSITFTPTHPYDFAIRMFAAPDDDIMRWTIAGSEDDNDDPTQERTERIIKNFLVRRGGQIISKEPDLTKRLGRRAPPRRSLKDAPPLKLGGPVTVTGKGTEHNNRLAFSTSLRQVAGSLLSAKQRRVGDTAAALRVLGNNGPRGDSDVPTNSDARNVDHASDLGGAMGLGYGSYGRPQTGFGLWAEGNWARINDGPTGSDFGLLYIGADYRFRPGFVVGLLAQIDQTDEEDQTNNFSIKGRGWLAGPYVVARLSSKLILDARVAWGKSDNEVSPYNTYADKFEGRRWLARGRLTGDFEFGRLHIAPHIGVVYFEEEQKAYTDSLGNAISAQKVELGRLTFGPKLSTTFTRPDGATVTPHVAVHGIWDFRRTDLVNIDTGLALTGTDDFRARAQAGVTARRADGMAITAEGFYDGIGAKDFDAYGGTLRIDMPF